MAYAKRLLARSGHKNIIISTSVVPMKKPGGKGSVLKSSGITRRLL